MQKPSALFRWLVLFVISMAMLGNYYLYDSIAPVADILQDKLGFSDSNIGQLYSVYSLASILILIPGGFFIDRYGTKISILLFGSICTLAGFVTWLSEGLTMMLAGRLLLGLGAEPLIVAITASIAKWFKGKEISFALGVNLFIARGGSYFADNSANWLPGLYESGWKIPLEFAAFIGLFCLAGGLIYFFMERYAEKNFDLGRAGETDKLVLKDIFRFSKSFWFIVLLCVTFYSAVFPFRSFAIKYFMDAHEITRASAGQMLSLLPLTAMFATPFLGLLADYIGRRATLMLFGSVILIPVFLLMAYQLLPLGIPVMMLGLSFSLIPAVMWPAVAYLVHETRLGTAYAVMTLIQQIGVALFNYLIGASNDFFGAGELKPQGYIPGMWIFSSLGIAAFLFSFLLFRNQKRTKGELEHQKLG